MAFEEEKVDDKECYQEEAEEENTIVTTELVVIRKNLGLPIIIVSYSSSTTEIEDSQKDGKK